MRIQHHVAVWIWRVVLVMVVAFTIADVSRVQLESLWDDHLYTLTDGWTVTFDKDVRHTDLSLPTVLADEDHPGLSVVLSNTIPENLVRPYSLMFRTSQKRVEVLLDGQSIYSYDAQIDARKVKVIGYINHAVWLPEVSEGKLLEIHLVSQDSRSGMLLYDVYIGSRVSQLVALLRYDGLSLLFGSLMLLLSLTVFLFSLTLFRKMDIQQHAFAFAGIECCAGLWVICGSMSTQLLVHNQLFLLVGGMIALYFLPVFVTRFVNGMYALKESRIFSRVAWLFPIWFVLISMFQLFGLTDYHVWFIPAAFALRIYFLTLVGFSIKAYVQGNRPVGQFLVAFVCLLISITGELILLLMPSPSLLNALVLNLGISAFGLVLLRQMLIRIMRYIKIRGKEEYLVSLARTDALTGVANRTAFEEHLGRLREQFWTGPLAIMVFDVNDLKELNDLRGHAVGDMVLRTIAEELTVMFKDIGTIYRIGGDEFVMISERCECTQYEQVLSTLQSEGSCHTVGGELVNVAWGDAVWHRKAAYPSVDALFAEADDQMYQRKVRMKRSPVR